MRPGPSRRAGRRRAAGRSGLALGMGLDRLLMLAKHIPDIRLLRSGDPRIGRQMLELADTSVSPRCPRSPGTCPSPSPMTTMRKLSAAGSAMPSAPTPAVSRKSGYFPLPPAGTCPRQRSAASAPNRGKEPAGPRLPPRPGQDTHQPGRQCPPRPDLPGASPGDGVPMGRITRCRSQRQNALSAATVRARGGEPGRKILATSIASPMGSRFRQASLWDRWVEAGKA